jgi:hypothetical protein
MTIETTEDTRGSNRSKAEDEASVRAKCEAIMAIEAALTNREEAGKFAESFFFHDKLVRCGQRAFAYMLEDHNWDIELTEVQNPSTEISDTRPVTEAGQSSGLEYQGSVFLRTEAYRVWDSKSHKWGAWRDGNLEEHFPHMEVVKLNGEWSGDAVPRVPRWETATAGLTCAAVPKQ